MLSGTETRPTKVVSVIALYVKPPCGRRRSSHLHIRYVRMPFFLAFVSDVPCSIVDELTLLLMISWSFEVYVLRLPF